MRVNFFATYRNLTGVRGIDVNLQEGITVRQAVDQILYLFPVLQPHWINGNGELHAHLTVVLNHEDIASTPDGLQTKLKPNDELSFVPPVGGG